MPVLFVKTLLSNLDLGLLNSSTIMLFGSSDTLLEQGKYLGPSQMWPNRPGPTCIKKRKKTTYMKE